MVYLNTYEAQPHAGSFSSSSFTSLTFSFLSVLTLTDALSAAPNFMIFRESSVLPLILDFLDIFEVVVVDAIETVVVFRSVVDVSS